MAIDKPLTGATASWKERTQLAIIYAVLWGAVFPAMFFGFLIITGMMVEGAGGYWAHLDRCQKHAETPYEYHQCK